MPIRPAEEQTVEQREHRVVGPLRQQACETWVEPAVDADAVLDKAHDGLDLARACIATAARHLKPGGFAVLQVGTREQVDRLAGELDGHGEGLRLRELRGFERGVLVTGLTYPVVPRGDEEIRTQVNADHTEADIDYVLTQLESFA